MGGDQKAQKARFVQDNYDLDDDVFFEQLRRTGWFADPIIQEVARRLKESPLRTGMDMFLAVVQDHGHKARVEQLEKREESSRALLRQLQADVFEAERANRDSKPVRRGPKSEALDFVKRLLEQEGWQVKSRLVDALARKWPGKNRSAFSTTINRAIKRGDLVERAGRVAVPNV